MSTIIVKPKNKEEKKFLTRLLKKMNINTEVIEDDSPNDETLKAIEDVEKKKGTKAENSEDLFKQLGI
mgnify:CR=1 FL=1